MIQTRVLPHFQSFPSPPKPHNPVHTDLITGTKLDWRTRSWTAGGTRLWTSVCTLQSFQLPAQGAEAAPGAAPEWGNTVK